MEVLYDENDGIYLVRYNGVVLPLEGSTKIPIASLIDFCFLPNTPILLADGTTKPIEAIRSEDRVMSYDNRGILVPRRVTRVFVSDVAHVLDFHGTGVTPGHVFLCGAGRFAGRHVPLIDILRDDGAVVRQDGSLMRAATGCAVGSDADRLIEVVAADGTTGRLRAGARVAAGTGQVTVSALIAQAGGTVCDGRVSLPGAPALQPFAWAGSLPAPEDDVLRQSGVTLAGIYVAEEWETPLQMTAALDVSTPPQPRPAPPRAQLRGGRHQGLSGNKNRSNLAFRKESLRCPITTPTPPPCAPRC
jgi:hypothetical protein